MRAIEIFSEDTAAEAKLSKDSANNKIFDTGDDLYIIVEGSVTVVVKDPGGRNIMFSLDNNDVFGNIPFVDFGHEPNSAIITASRDLKTEKLDVVEIQNEYDKLSRTFKNLIYNICNYIRNTTGLVNRLSEKN